MGQSAESALQFNITNDRPEASINLKPSQIPGKHTVRQPIRR